jgi:hypothetical protein
MHDLSRAKVSTRISNLAPGRYPHDRGIAVFRPYALLAGDRKWRKPIMSMRIPVYLLAVLALAAQMPMAFAKSLHPDYALKRGDVQIYGDWMVGCSRIPACTMMGIPNDRSRFDPGVLMTGIGLRIIMSGPTGTPPTVDLVPLSLPQLNGKPISIPPFRLGDGQTRVFEYAFSPLLAEEAAWLLERLQRGENLFGHNPQTGNAVVRFPSLEFSRAFRAMRRHKALLADSAGQPLDAPGALRRFTAEPLMVSGYAPFLSASKCGGGGMRDVRRYRFPNGEELIGETCENGRSFWQMSGPGPTGTSRLELPEPRDGAVRASEDGLSHAIFDFDFEVLRDYRYVPTHDDCGSMRAWAFTQFGWRLIERREMPVCAGLKPDIWIQTHFLPTDSAPRDE